MAQQPTVGNIRLSTGQQSAAVVQPPPNNKDYTPAILGVMSSLVCMGILFGSKRTMNVALAQECVSFAKELYNLCQSQSS